MVDMFIEYLINLAACNASRHWSFLSGLDLGGRPRDTYMMCFAVMTQSTHPYPMRGLPPDCR